MSVKVQEVTKSLEFSEGPHWDSRVQALYFISVFEQTIRKYDPATRFISTSSKLDGQLGFIVPIEGVPDQFVVGLENKFAVVHWDGKDGSSVKVVQVLAEVDKDGPAKMRINDGKADPRGRLFAGTMARDYTFETTETGFLYRLDGAKTTKVEQGIAITNGLSWDLKEKAFYYTDTVENKIRRYDYDVETGDISNLRYVFDFKESGIEGMPDGHTIDTDGNLWIAVMAGSCVLQVDPRTGKVLQKVPIPTKQVTSVTFGGANHDILYVTTASKTTFLGEQKYPSGCIFEVTGLGVTGHPNRNFRL